MSLMMLITLDKLNEVVLKILSKKSTDCKLDEVIHISLTSGHLRVIRMDSQYVSKLFSIFAEYHF